MGSENKYNARKHSCMRGHTHDSRKEANRCDELHMLQRRGYISDLDSSVKFELVPAQYVEENGKRKCKERAVNYIADFVYYENDKMIVEDVKGYRGNTGAYNLFKLKRKLMLFKYGIEVREV